jgi:cytochrome c oxidase assembly protein subunit 15
MVTNAATRLRSFEISPSLFRTLAITSATALWLIVVTGATVRLTSSGLGCESWPGCHQGQPFPANDIHSFIEFGIGWSAVSSSSRP